MNNSTPVQETNSIPSHAIVDEHRVLSEKIDAASHVINIFFATSANQTRFDVNKIIALLEELRDIAQAHFRRHGTVPFSPDIGVNLQSWLTYHIKKYDEAYVSFIEASDPTTRIC